MPWLVDEKSSPCWLFIQAGTIYFNGLILMYMENASVRICKDERTQSLVYGWGSDHMWLLISIHLIFQRTVQKSKQHNKMFHIRTEYRKAGTLLYGLAMCEQCYEQVWSSVNVIFSDKGLWRCSLGKFQQDRPNKQLLNKKEKQLYVSHTQKKTIHSQTPNIRMDMYQWEYLCGRAFGWAWDLASSNQSEEPQHLFLFVCVCV